MQAELTTTTTTITRRPLRDSQRRYRPAESPPHPCALCGRTCPGRRSHCMACKTRIRRFIVKAAAVELLGGVAICCGWQGGLAELSGYVFHHRDDNKEFQIGLIKNKSWDVIRAEVLKCDLWCARCHCIHHSAYGDPRFLTAVAGYQGSLSIMSARVTGPSGDGGVGASPIASR